MVHGTVELAGAYRGLTEPPRRARARPGPDARFGVLSDIDDTILETGVQRAARMVRQTIAGSALTRSPFPGAPELYRDLAADHNPVFYVSSSPWNLHAFLLAFLATATSRSAPVLLRDLLGTAAGREQKAVRIHRVLDLHPDLRFVLIGDSGERDPEIYADVVRTYPGRILAVYIREVRLDPGDGRVRRSPAPGTTTSPSSSPPDSDAVRRHAAGPGSLLVSRAARRSSRAEGRTSVEQGRRPVVETSRLQGRVSTTGAERPAQPSRWGVAARRLSRAGGPCVETRAAPRSGFDDGR